MGKQIVGYSSITSGQQNAATVDEFAGGIKALSVQQPVLTDLFSKRYDRPGGGVVYVGWCAPGQSAATDEAIWRIQRIQPSEASPTLIDWADGDLDFNNVWDDRASLSYS